jgi:pimeloyl-ACP methyl ester carboxylesterase
MPITESAAGVGRSPSVYFAQRPALETALASAENAYSLANLHEQNASSTCVDFYYQCIAFSWQHLRSNAFFHGDSRRPWRANELYSSSLAKLIQTGQRFGRLDPSRGIRVNSGGRIVDVGITYYGFAWHPEDFDGLVLVGEYYDRRISRQFRQPGFGVPLVAVRQQGPSGQPRTAFINERQVIAATALSRPPLDEVVAKGESRQTEPFTVDEAAGRAALELYNPLAISHLECYGLILPLVGDITAQFAFGLQNYTWSPLEAYINPDATSSAAKLYMLEPYQPGKIPVLFIHGLFSAPITYVDLANELRANRQLYQRYQFWAFEYPTGGPFLEAATNLRHQLYRAVSTCASVGPDPALSQMVVVGHSMGGLVAKLQITESGATLWYHIANKPLEQIVVDEKARAQIASQLFFSPSPHIKRVLFIATPHDGSPWAVRPVGRISAGLVNFTQEDDERWQELITDNPGVFEPSIRNKKPTSVALLRQGNPLLTAMQQLRVNPDVRLHSIIGTGRRLLVAGPADGVVPVESARHPGVRSEIYVPATHTSIQRHRDTIREVERILLTHLTEFDGGG